ncbi:MAG: tRNA 2-thiocytidine(32) synthetase TtcA [Deltaproteobacteria bacterium]|nr:tRNA 2-thiocytidine(32) synthetase TtcA [Deltaproteobacteria bacterium]
MEKRLLREVGRALADWAMIADGDRVLVAVSGGKDSYGLLSLLRVLQARAPIHFDLVAVHIDQGHPGYDGEPLRRWLEDHGYTSHIVREDTYSVVTEKTPEGGTFCALCSRLRRGILYSTAARLGCNKIALGHHREDAVETLLLNAFFNGRLAAMPARLTSDDGAHTVLRPLLYCPEAWLEAYAREKRFPILPCDLCGSQDNLQRKRMKALLGELEGAHPGVKASLLASLGNVRPSQLLDRSLQFKPGGPRRLPVLGAEGKGA